MTNVTPLFADDLSPAQLRAQQSETMLQARRWLNPAQLAALLLDRSRDDLAHAVDELLQAADDSITCWIQDEEMNACDREKMTFFNAHKAFEKLVEHYSIETICELVREFEFPNDAT